MKRIITFWKWLLSLLTWKREHVIILRIREDSMVKKTKSTAKVVEPSTGVEVVLPSSEPTIEEPQPPNTLPFYSIGRNNEGRMGVYALQFDVANNQLVKTDFYPEEQKGAVIERFKILAAGLFKVF